MHIGIDARFSGVAGKGLGRYASELIAALEETDIRHDVTVFLRKDNYAAYTPRNPRFRKVLAEFPWYGWREQLLFPLFLRRHRLDLMHFCHFNVPLLYRRPFAVTVHDLILTKFPSRRASTLAPWLYALKDAAYRMVIASAVRRARHVFAMSEFGKRDILETFPGTDAAKISVTLQAPGTFMTGGRSTGGWDAPGDGDVEIPEGKFALYVGNAYPHKNLETLLAAFAAFRAAGHGDWRLVLVGGSDYFYDRLAAGHHGEGVVFFGRASDAQLAALYDRAQLYVFPSRYEGFGIPPLEAMARGLPVVSSDASCMPEILGDAALYFDPTDAAAMAAAMTMIADDAALAGALREKGRERVAQYSWKRCAEQTLAGYERSLA